jgi:hypothetical protein
MAKPEMNIEINLEPTEETVQVSKLMLEMWLNAAPGRSIKVVDKWDEDGNLKSYLEVLEISDTYICEEC